MRPGSPALLVSELLGPDDGPYDTTALGFLNRKICEQCWRRPIADDDLCASCIEVLERRELHQTT